MIYYLFGRSWIENVPSATVELYTKIFQKFRLFNIVNLWGSQSRTTIWLKRDVSQIAAWLVGFVRDMKKTKIRAHSSTSKPSTAWRKRASQCIYERSALGLWVCLFIAFHPASKSRWSTGKSTLIAMWYNDMLAIWGTLKRKREANFLLSLHCGSPGKPLRWTSFSVSFESSWCVQWCDFPRPYRFLGWFFAYFRFLCK